MHYPVVFSKWKSIVYGYVSNRLFPDVYKIRPLLLSDFSQARSVIYSQIFTLALLPSQSFA